MHRKHALRHALRATLTLVACAAVLLGAASVASAGPLFITLTFDDGDASQYTHRSVLNDAGVDATFYVNSGNIGGGYMTYTELNELETEGHEVGGHTINHVNLTTRTTGDARTQICDDRTELIRNGLDVRNFAYPFGARNTTVEGLVRDCGYTTARTTGGTDYEGPEVTLPPGSVLSETLPAANPYRLRAFQIGYNTPLEVYRDIIVRGRDAGGGWLPIVFHEVCSGSCTGHGSYDVRVELLRDLIAWIQADPALRLRTAARVIEIGNDRTAPAATLTAPTDRTTVAPSTVRLEATATDAVGVERVDFIVDSRVVGSDSSSPYSYDWDASRHGSTAVIAAYAYDEKGNVGRSATATVAVRASDTTPPTVGLTSPSSNANVSGYVGVHSTASDAGSGIARVDWIVNGSVAASDTTSPYEASWDAAPLLGTSPTIVARAYDGAGNHATTATRRVNVVSPRSSMAPTVRTVTPAGGTTVSGWIELTADTTGSANAIAYVEIFVDGQQVGIDWGAPFYEWWNANTAAGPTASFVARAVDVYGNHTDSAPLVLTISR